MEQSYVAVRGFRADGIGYERGQSVPLGDITNSDILKRTSLVALENSDEGESAIADYERYRAEATPDSPSVPDEVLTVPDEAGRSALLANGYDADAKVAAASDGELLSVNGIGQATLEKIRLHLGA